MTSSQPSSLRRRGGGKRNADGTSSMDIAPVSSQGASNPAWEWDYRIALVIMTALAFATRFYKIDYPNEVVFDEVHFGKFASYYLRRTYFFDVHPPFGKLLLAFVGWLAGYDGHYEFDNIGESYIDNNVPYVALRSMPALLGSLTIPVVFLIMWESGYSLPACVLASGLMVFDNAHIGETRLILLDALFSAMSNFTNRGSIHSNERKWLLLTGVSLSGVISTKYVGVFTFVTIGSAVLIDLWSLLDINRREGALTLPEFGKHFVARLFGLISVPIFFFLFWFQVHFAILTKSGPGDEFMTPAFQETLSDSAITASAFDIEPAIKQENEARGGAAII
ncbi:Dolichyl-phosphate-mannose-protein mannosyltransferase domain containing protein [Elaphomyces granulatus]